MKQWIPAAVLGALLALGLVWAGSYTKSAAQVWEQSQRSITVKGLAEREVKANLALWPLKFTVSANTLSELESRLTAAEEKVRTFFNQAGIAAADISQTTPRITDEYANRFDNKKPDERYTAESILLVRTKEVDKVLVAMAKTNELLRQDVLLAPTYEYNTEFLFTSLEAIKPAMIAEATADARAAAQQFAQDSGSKVGKIITANQGYFSINDLDSYTPHTKRVRVVTTVQYGLEK